MLPKNRLLKKLCQLEGSDCGGRDRRPSWHWRALSIYLDGCLFNELMFGHQHHPQRVELYTEQGISQRLFCDESDKSVIKLTGIQVYFYTTHLF